MAEGRKMTEEQVEKVAQGHVFTGQDAQKIGLVDELGGLDVAVAKAAQLAKLPNHRTSAYPKEPNVLEQMLEQTKPNNYLSQQLRASLGNYYEPFTLLKTIDQQSAIQARLPFYPNIH